MRSGIRSLADGGVLSTVDIGKWLSSLRPPLFRVDARHPVIDGCRPDLVVQLGRKLRFADQP